LICESRFPHESNCEPSAYPRRKGWTVVQPGKSPSIAARHRSPRQSVLLPLNVSVVTRRREQCTLRLGDRATTRSQVAEGRIDSFNVMSSGRLGVGSSPASRFVVNSRADIHLAVEICVLLGLRNLPQGHPLLILGSNQSQVSGFFLSQVCKILRPSLETGIGSRLTGPFERLGP
jgi:hypothetical protein